MLESAKRWEITPIQYQYPASIPLSLSPGHAIGIAPDIEIAYDAKRFQVDDLVVWRYVGHSWSENLSAK